MALPKINELNCILIIIPIINCIYSRLMGLFTFRDNLIRFTAYATTYDIYSTNECIFVFMSFRTVFMY